MLQVDCQNKITKLDDNVVGIRGEIGVQLLQGFFVLPFGHELAAASECRKRTLTLKFPLQPALRQFGAQLRQIGIDIASCSGIPSDAGG